MGLQRWIGSKIQMHHWGVQVPSRSWTQTSARLPCSTPWSELSMAYLTDGNPYLNCLAHHDTAFCGCRLFARRSDARVWMLRRTTPTISALLGEFTELANGGNGTVGAELC